MGLCYKKDTHSKMRISGSERVRFCFYMAIF